MHKVQLNCTGKSNTKCDYMSTFFIRPNTEAEKQHRHHKREEQKNKKTGRCVRFLKSFFKLHLPATKYFRYFFFFFLQPH